MENSLKFSFFGDRSILINTGEKISEESGKRCMNTAYLIEKDKIEGVVEVHGCYNAILLIYDPLRIEADLLIKRIQKIEHLEDEIALPTPKIYEIPTLYGGEYGPDLEHVAEYNGISPEEVITIHTKEPLWLFHIATCLHSLTPVKLMTPRQKVPRVKVPAGGVGIANKQTGPYILDGTGGWNLIGRTPLRIYDPQRDPPFLFSAGNYVHYKSIDLDTFNAMKSNHASTLKINYRQTKDRSNGSF